MEYTIKGKLDVIERCASQVEMIRNTLYNVNLVMDVFTLDESLNVDNCLRYLNTELTKVIERLKKEVKDDEMKENKDK